MTDYAKTLLSQLPSQVKKKKKLIKKSMAKLCWNICHSKIELVSNIYILSISFSTTGFFLIAQP